MKNLVHLLRRNLSFLLETAVSKPYREETSFVVKDQKAIRTFKEDSSNSFLVSFPRTGSHWLRMLMELYFGRPSLIRVFYYPDCTEYLTLHTHDLELDVICSHAIYLYRDPVDTIFSQLQYHKEPLDDQGRISYWSDLYGRHLHKWLHCEEFTQKKTVIRYELLKSNLADEFKKVCEHFNESFDNSRLENVAERVTKERVKEKTRHDPQVISTKRTYDAERQRFRNEHSELVWSIVLNDRNSLQHAF